MVLFFAVSFLFIAGRDNRGMAAEDGDETFGNNLSFPVIWSDSVTKALRGSQGAEPVTEGAWWYWWGQDTDGNPLSCAPDNDDNDFCDDGIAGSVNYDNTPGSGNKKVYLQQDPDNIWQAETIMPHGNLTIDWIDWGDNLESVPWYLHSMVRVEVVLINDVSPGALQYDMRHVSGWGKDEMWGLVYGHHGGAGSDELYSSQATVYSHCARLTIQKISAGCEDEDFFWSETESRWVGECVAPPIFTGAVREAEDGPGSYSAEINVKGKVIYGYTWDVRDMNEGVGTYRLTFSLDPETACPELNTMFSSDHTAILVAAEEELAGISSDSGDSGDVPSGGTAIISPEVDNVTYIDIAISEKENRKGQQR